MSTSDDCNDSASKSNDGICEINDKLQNMKTADEEDKVSTNTCANCGKEGSDVTNKCNKCKMVMYCNAACKKKHRHKHKKECEEHLRLASERAAELHDEALFKQPPLEYEDCPICFLRMPYLCTGKKYQSCCGKVICSGCFYANANIDLKKQLCAFCRTKAPQSDEDAVGRLSKRVEAGEALATYNLGCHYRNGEMGFPQNYTKALELFHKAAELGYPSAYYNVGYAYNHGYGAEVDKKKSIHYWELAAMGGCVNARHNLGCEEGQAFNFDRALRHFMIAVRGGNPKSLESIKRMYSNGLATKDDYSKALQSYQSYLEEIRSDQRDKAAAASDRFKYIT